MLKNNIKGLGLKAERLWENNVFAVIILCNFFFRLLHFTEYVPLIS